MIELTSQPIDVTVTNSTSVAINSAAIEVQAEVAIQSIDITLAESTQVVATVAPQEIAITLQMQGKGEKGDKGDQGIDNGVATMPAGEAIGGHRLVYISSGAVYYASADNLQHLGKVIGVSMNAASIGGPVEIRSVGYLTDNSFAFTDGPIYLGTNGLLTQDSMVGLFIQQVATQLTATEIFVSIGQGIVRG
jgi:hypothetical protein